MTYEELYYTLYTDKQLIKIINDDSQLDAFRNRCKLELSRRTYGNLIK